MGCWYDRTAAVVDGPKLLLGVPSSNPCASRRHWAAATGEPVELSRIVAYEVKLRLTVPQFTGGNAEPRKRCR